VKKPIFSLKKLLFAVRYRKSFRKGMGLHYTQLWEIWELTKGLEKVHIIEFGSGASTGVLENLYSRKKKNFRIVSFDHLAAYAHKPKSPQTKVLIRPLENWSDAEFENFFESKVISRPGSLLAEAALQGFRQKNSFYRIAQGDLNLRADVIILDGPNGNGRSLGFLHTMHSLAEKAYFLIDDLNHYDFENRLMQIFPGARFVSGRNDSRVHPLFSWGIYEVGNYLPPNQ